MTDLPASWVTLKLGAVLLVFDRTHRVRTLVMPGLLPCRC